MMKKLIFSVCIVGLAALIFAGGLVAGTKMDLFKRMFSTSFLENQEVEAAKTFMVIKMLDDSQIDEAKAYLNSQLDANIMGIGMFTPEFGDSKNIETGNKILSRIAKHRQKYPSTSGQKNVSNAIQGYLDKALSQVEKIKQNNPAQSTGKPAPDR